MLETVKSDRNAATENYIHNLIRRRMNLHKGIEI